MKIGKIMIEEGQLHIFGGTNQLHHKRLKKIP